MSRAAKKKASPKKARGEMRGPKPDLLKIEGDWKAAMKTALNKKRPPQGWPKPQA